MLFGLRPGIRRLLRLPVRSTEAIHAEIDAELESLIANRVDHLVAQGMPPSDARREALRRVGPSLDDARLQLHHSAEHRERRMRFTELLESIAQDIRYAARGLMRRPAFAAVAVATLAVGVGGTTAIFSAVNVLLLRQLPYPKPDELMKVSLVTPPRGSEPGHADMVWSYPKFIVFRNAQHVFSELALNAVEQATLTSGDVERDRVERVGATYLRTLGIAPVRGRDFERSIDAHAGAPREVILGYALWERRYNADPSIVGKAIDIDREPYTVVGIAPRDFKGLSGVAELFLPITTQRAEELNQPQMHEYYLVARRAPGVTAAHAASAVVALGARVNEAYPNTYAKGAWSAEATPLNDARLAPAIRRSLLVLFGAVGFVLLIACVNVANLMLGRASVRRREIAVRLAIGAERARVIRLLLTESLLLALIGAVVSLILAWIGVRALDTINPATTLRVGRDSGFGAIAFSAISLDWRALGFAVGVSLVVGLLFGLAPALGTTRHSALSLTDALKGDRPTRRAASASMSRRVLVIAEVALALVLLAGSGLMIRSLAKLLATDPGFDGASVLTVRLAIPPDVMPRDSMPGFYAELLDRLRALPGVADASINDCAPLSGGCGATGMQRLDVPSPDIAHSPLIGVHWVSPTWFSSLRIPLLRGRMFTNADRASAPKVIIVNDAAARTFWHGENPIGKHVATGVGGWHDVEVIGVVRGVRQKPDSEPMPDFYLPYAQSPRPGMIIFVRSLRDPASLGTEVRRAVHEMAPMVPVYDMQTMAERSAGATAQARFRAVLLALFALTALSLAAVGIYGVMSLVVTARTREIGIRIALGAERGRVQRLVIGEGIGLASAGAILGIAGALAATQLLRTFLFDLTPTDPVTYAAIVLVLGAATLAASWIPARRASRVDPVVALRAE